MQGAGGARTLSNGGTGRPAATLMRALSGWTLISLSEAQCLPVSHARLSTRQGATVFNQPLSFDTSKVTNMHDMFSVRSARALAPTQP